MVPAEAIPELAEELRLRPGSTLLDLACGRGAYGLLVAKQAGAPLIGVDFSAQALAEAREQAARMGVSNASFRVGELTATGLPDASVDAVLCTDAIQFPDEPAIAYEEIRRVLKPGGRVVLTCWEPFDRDDERLSPRLRRANLAAGLHQAGFTDVEVRDRPSWLAREHALWEEAAALDPGDDPALRSLQPRGCAVPAVGRPAPPSTGRRYQPSVTSATLCQISSFNPVAHDRRRDLDADRSRMWDLSRRVLFRPSPKPATYGEGVMPARRKWSDLSGRSRTLIISVAVADGILKAAALIDIKRRPASQIRGPKWVWAPVVAVVNSAGVVPTSYFVFGRRQPQSQPD